MSTLNTFRNNISGNFTTVPNSLVNDESLSWKAKGIFLYLASKPDNWQFYMTEIENNATDGRTALQSGIKELEDADYLVRNKCHSDNGEFEGYTWILKEATDRAIDRQTENPSDGKPDRRKTASHSNINSINTNNSNTDIPEIDYVSFVDYWNECNDCNLRVTDKKREMIRARLRNFSEDEIKRSILNRSKNEWINGDGKKYKTDWKSFWRNDEKVENYLTQDPKENTFDPYSGSF